MNTIRRIEKLEAAVVMGRGIPKEEQLQIIKGNMTEGGFIPDKPGDSIETRKLGLVRRFGNADGAIFIQLVDRFGKPAPKQA